MKKSPYKITMFIFSIINLVLLFVICVHLGIINISIFDSIWNMIKNFFVNDYVVNILCTIITAIGLYAIQIWYSKRKIRNDFRCNEVIVDIYDGIEKVRTLGTKFENVKGKADKIKSKYDYTNPNLTESERNEIAFRRMDSESEIYIDFFRDNKLDIDLCQDILMFTNNDILTDSIQIVFFINLNFKLLNILNNIKNRKPNINGKFECICDDYKKHIEDKTNKQLQYNLGSSIKHYTQDLIFLSNYYNDLLDYLGYDPILVKINNEAFMALYPTPEKIKDYLNLPLQKKLEIQKTISKESKKGLRKYKISKFFQKDK